MKHKEKNDEINERSLSELWENFKLTDNPSD